MLASTGSDRISRPQENGAELQGLLLAAASVTATGKDVGRASLAPLDQVHPKPLGGSWLGM